MANFKRKHYRSKTMKKCSICGSQRRFLGDKETKYRDLKKKVVLEQE